MYIFLILEKIHFMNLAFSSSYLTYESLRQNFVGKNILIAFEIILVVKSQKIKKLLL